MNVSISSIFNFVNNIYFKNTAPQICVPRLISSFINMLYKPLFNTFFKVCDTLQSLKLSTLFLE